MPTSPDDATDDAGPDYRQLSVVALAAVAIVLAAFLAPAGGGIASPNPDVDPNADPNADPESMRTDGEPRSPDDVPSIDVRWFSLLENLGLDWFDSGETEPAPEPEPNPDPDDGPGGTAGCIVRLSDDPTPGKEVTAVIVYESEPVADADVWYNDEYVGETDDRGRVTGEIPYVEQLVIRIESTEYPACTAVEETASMTAAAGTIGAGAGPSAMPSAATATAVATDGADIPPRSVDTARTRTQQVEEAEDGTVEYEVEGDVNIALRGPPDPGETVVVEADIDGVPMANASVTVDGEAVAETDADGTATIEIPDDGTESFELGVSRGDFSGTTTVEVRLLEVSLSPDGVVPVPGSSGVLEATIDDEPVADAEVRIGGELVGTTDENGTLPITLPTDPRTAITVSTADRTETVSLLGLYGGIALVLALVVVALTVVAYRTHGPRAAAAVVGATAATLLVLVVEAFYGPAAGGATLLALVGLAAGVVYLRGDRSILEQRPAAGDAVDGTFEWVVDRLLALVARLERGVDWLRVRLGAVRAWAASLPRSATGLAAAVRDWLATIPTRALAAGHAALAVVRRLPPSTIVAVLAAGPAVAAGYVVDGGRGATIVAIGLGIAALLYWRGDDEPESDDAEEPVEADDGDDGDGLEPTAETSDERLTFRELWRAFARRVEPRRWPKYTPGEIRRTARDQGYPNRPVDELTTLFREVEYGRRPLSSGVRDRADAAYTELVDDESDDNESADGEPAEEEPPAAESAEDEPTDGELTDGDGSATDDGTGGGPQ